jgi:hypothetical protein
VRRQQARPRRLCGNGKDAAALRPFGTKPPIKPPPPVVEVMPPPERIKLPSDPGAKPPVERQTGGIGRLMTPAERASAKPPAAPKPKPDENWKLTASDIPF